jgi:hypothetical protein
MVETLSDVFNVPVASSTILTIREANSFQRTLVFTNLHTGELTLRVDHSSDGGNTWTEGVVTTFALPVGDTLVKNVAASYGSMLRVVASGGAATGYQLHLSSTRVYESSANWGRATV